MHDEFILATKPSNAAYDDDSALHDFDLAGQRVRRTDLYLLHWPPPPTELSRDPAADGPPA